MSKDTSRIAFSSNNKAPAATSGVMEGILTLHVGSRIPQQGRVRDGGRGVHLSSSSRLSRQAKSHAAAAVQQRLVRVVDTPQKRPEGAG